LIHQRYGFGGIFLSDVIDNTAQGVAARITSFPTCKKAFPTGVRAFPTEIKAFPTGFKAFPTRINPNTEVVLGS